MTNADEWMADAESFFIAKARDVFEEGENRTATELTCSSDITPEHYMAIMAQAILLGCRLFKECPETVMEDLGDAVVESKCTEFTNDADEEVGDD